VVVVIVILVEVVILLVVVIVVVAVLISMFVLWKECLVIRMRKEYRSRTDEFFR
jgi:hypothetical protein